MMTKCDTGDAAVLGIISFELHLFPKLGTVLLAGIFLKVNNVFLFWPFCGKHYFASCD